MTKKELVVEFQSMRTRFGPTEKWIYDVVVTFSENKFLYINHSEYHSRINVRDAAMLDSTSVPLSMTICVQNREYAFHNARDEHRFAAFIRRVQSSYDKGLHARSQEQQSKMLLDSKFSRGRQQPHRGKHQRREFGKASALLFQKAAPPATRHHPRYQESFSEDEVEEEKPNDVKTNGTIASLQENVPLLEDETLARASDPPGGGTDEEDEDDDDETLLPTRKNKGSMLGKTKKVIHDDEEESSDDDFLHRPRNLTTPAVQRVVSPSMTKSIVMDTNQEGDAVGRDQRTITSFFPSKKNTTTNSSPTREPMNASSPSPMTTTPTRLPASAARLVKSAKSTIRQQPWLSNSPTRFNPTEKREHELLGYSTAGKPHPLDLLDQDLDRIESTPPRLNISRVLKRPRLLPHNGNRFSDSSGRIRRPPMTPLVGNLDFGSEDGDENRPVSRYRGIQNLGNTCYCAATLQMVYSAFDFIKSIEGRGGRLTKSLVNVAHALQEVVPFNRPVDPRVVKQAMDARTDRFVGFEQRDAHEFMGELVDAVHEELEEELKKNSTSSGETKERLPTDDFRMTVHKVLKCESCGYSRTMDEMYRYLSVDIVNGGTAEGDSFATDQLPSVETGLSHYFQPDLRELKCEKCGDGTHATESLYISERSRFLLLHLKRFIWVERRLSVATAETGENLPPNGPVPPVDYVFQKNKAAVSIPETLTLDSFCKADDGSVRESSRYKLKSIVHHIGQRPSSGHYIAHAIRPFIDGDNENKPQSNPNVEERTSEALQYNSDPHLSLNENEKRSVPPATPTEATMPPVEKFQWVGFDDTNTSIVDIDQILQSKNRQSTAYMLLYAADD